MWKCIQLPTPHFPISLIGRNSNHCRYPKAQESKGGTWSLLQCLETDSWRWQSLTQLWNEIRKRLASSNVTSQIEIFCQVKFAPNWNIQAFKSCFKNSMQVLSYSTSRCPAARCIPHAPEIALYEGAMLVPIPSYRRHTSRAMILNETKLG
jgi:hypothetical protein